MKLNEPEPRLRLPLMKTLADATALCEQEKDGFYLTAFAAQCWLGQLVVQAAAEYAEKKNPKDRSLQSGLAWQGFLKLFPQPEDKDFPAILSHVFRFAEYEDPLAAMLRHALYPLSVEHDCTGDYFGPKTMNVARDPKAGPQLARRSLIRWCDWLDALIHFQTHQHWHMAPTCFDPDPDKRELAALGANQRHWVHLDDSAKAWWQWHFSEAAERFKDSPKWPTLGRAMSADADRLWQYADVDALVIGLWPLVKQNNWTYRDLLNVIRPGINRPEAYPCAAEQEFAAYCTNILGLRKTTKGVTAKDGQPAGLEIAKQLCPHPSHSSHPSYSSAQRADGGVRPGGGGGGSP
jgi:hypothetical protein